MNPSSNEEQPKSDPSEAAAAAAAADQTPLVPSSSDGQVGDANALAQSQSQSQAHHAEEHDATDQPTHAVDGENEPTAEVSPHGRYIKLDARLGSGAYKDV
jgi:hypothetical protein